MPSENRRRWLEIGAYFGLTMAVIVLSIVWGPGILKTPPVSPPPNADQLLQKEQERMEKWRQEWERTGSEVKVPRVNLESVTIDQAKLRKHMEEAAKTGSPVRQSKSGAR